MNVNRDLERQLTDFYESEAPPRAPDWVLRSALQTIDSTRQRRVVIRVPRRFPPMNTFAKVAIAAVVVIAVGALGLSVLGPRSPSGVGTQPTASPSTSPTASPTITPQPPPSLAETFTSSRYGFSISYPTGWVARPATDAWATGLPDFGATTGDVMYDPVLQDHLWIMVASQPLAGKTATQWVDDFLAGLGGAGECGASIEPVAIDATQGKACGTTAVTASGDRGYVVTLYTSGDNPSEVAGYDQAYFTDLLATLRLRPQDAVDASASPAA